MTMHGPVANADQVQDNPAVDIPQALELEGLVVRRAQSLLDTIFSHQWTTSGHPAASTLPFEDSAAPSCPVKCPIAPHWSTAQPTTIIARHKALLTSEHGIVISLKTQQSNIMGEQVFLPSSWKTQHLTSGVKVLPICGSEPTKVCGLSS
eukprot:CAMPEP_0181171448 /NCGR_PEP_ID=MMETSP1096-20121128/1914_1 /TAXON_ID=156174 ORGANISM="Chrysochromulina ericina, Strain CCMP281" /NCGR_SAMPLE_ID=MMETSP1096 /ASSEMBLY_ACC=CAM_ASM_000453 /LENGTH=149 /DNA_ID=CAMNT_0023259095 /DNA_START=1016 /DNA_END=1466 /DNA_ORIENTATION=-